MIIMFTIKIDKTRKVDMNQRWKLILMIALIVVGSVAGFFLTFKLAVVFAPFIIALAISSFIEPPIRFLMKKTKLSRKVAALISLLTVAIVFGSLIVLLISRIYREAESLYQILPGYIPEIYHNISSLINKASDIYFGLPKEVTISIDNMVSNITDSVPKVLKSLMSGILNTAVSIPQAIIFVIVTMLSTFFLSSDRDSIYNYIKSNFPEALINKIISIKNDMFMALFGYIRAQLILMSITFIELSIGFWIIGVRHFILLASIIAVIDALPILGTGGVLIPWAIYEFITTDFTTGIKLIILYGIVLVVRQLIEPKVLGQQIGLHPLITLMSMYLGLRIFSYPGLIIGPVTVLLLKNIISGILKKRSLKEFVNEYLKKGQ